jgi:hypothetical protein
MAMIGGAWGEKEKFAWRVIAKKFGVEKQKKFCTEQ